ncbi:MAG: hypothetical protein QF473_15165 [Planctomycetota bacterium]|jgi:hypothetical protein|nr:hypothetical protein [Planctomycetota bacterium]
MLLKKRFGCAKKLYARSEHPRMLFSADDVEELKERIRSSDAREIFRAIQSDACKLLDRVPKRRTVSDLMFSKKEKEVELAGAINGQSFHLALVGELTGNDRAIRLVEQTLEAFSQQEIAGPPKRDSRKEIPYTLYLAYDLLFHHLDSGIARSFREWSLQEAIEKFQPLMEREAYIASGMNMPLGHCRCALVPSLAIQGDEGVPDLSDVLRSGARFMQAFCRTGIGPDGFPEEDVGYGTGCTSGATETGELLFHAGLFNMFKDPHWLNFGRAVLHFMQPWGRHLTITGDFGHGPTLGHGMSLVRIAHETNDPTILWMMNQLDLFGKSGVKLTDGLEVSPSYPSLFYLDAYDMPRIGPAEAGLPTAFRESSRGIVSMRSSWGKDATYAHVDGSQRHASVMGHWHCSPGHFSLTALGEYFSLDTGRYNCDFDQHSVMLVDGESPNSTNGEWGGVCVMGRLLDYTPGDLLDTTMTDSSQINDCFWSWRTVGLVKGEGVTPYLWTVDDVNKANDFREFWWTMQTHPKNSIRIRKEEVTVTGFRHGNQLDIGFSYPSPEEYPDPHTLKIEKDIISSSSWNYVTESMFRNYRKSDFMARSLLRRPRLLAKLSGYNGKLMAVMVPRRKGRKPTVIERLPTLPNSFAMKVHFPKVTDTLIFAYEHGFLEADGIAGIGDFVLVRRDRKTGEVIDHAMRNGSELSVAGKKFRPQD